MDYMPCTLLRARTNQDIARYMSEADVIFLNSTSHTRWVAEDSPIYRVGVPVGRIFGDVWGLPQLEKYRNMKKFRSKTGTLVADHFRHYDYRVCTCQALFREFCPEYVDTMFWSPHCVDVQNFDVPKDVDVLIWGALGTSADRRRVKNLLMKHVVAPGRQYDAARLIYKIALGGRKYTLVWLRSHGEVYRGSKLYRMISRAKVCCTAPVHQAPVGKYFENAACGSVTLTLKFTDREALGFEHGKNIWISSLGSYLKNLRFLLEHDALVKEMSRNAKELICTRHTPEIRGKELYEFFKRLTGKT